MTKAKDQRSHSMKEQAYNVDKDKDHKGLTTKAISLISRRSVAMNSLRGRLLASNIESNKEVRSLRILRSGVGVDTAYPSLNMAYCLSWIRRIGLVSFVVFGECRHGYAVSSMMDTAYWLSE
ncbi:hypothetical protein Tco_0972680 [Tanacetum coccineum]